jgi:hypothetical protein
VQISVTVLTGHDARARIESLIGTSRAKSPATMSKKAAAQVVAAKKQAAAAKKVADAKKAADAKLQEALAALAKALSTSQCTSRPRR